MTPQQEIQQFAASKMSEWGLTLKGWTFGWNTRRSSFGLCRLRHKRIELSSFLFSTISRVEQEDTVLHEIAHALDFEQRGRSAHDRIWKMWACRVGAKPERCKSMDAAEEARKAIKCKYTLRCPNGHEFHRHRFLRREVSCPTCNPNRYDERYKLTAQQNY